MAVAVDVGSIASSTTVELSCSSVSSNGSSTEGCFDAALVFLLDWDDCFLPSSWIDVRCKELKLQYPQQIPQNEWLTPEWLELEDLLIRVFTMATARGLAYIVTNSERGWVELSCRTFFPRLCSVLEQHRVVPYSARTVHSSPQTRTPVEWKVAAFNVIFNCLPDVDTVVAFGDAPTDRQALFTASVGRQYSIRSTKLTESPSVRDLIEQWKLITSNLDRLYCGPQAPPFLDVCTRFRTGDDVHFLTA